MDADLRLEPAVGEVPLHLHRGAADPGLLARRRVEGGPAHPVIVHPHRVHAEEHRGPVAGVRPPRPGVHGEPAVGDVVGVGHHRLELQPLEARVHVGDAAPDAFDLGLVREGDGHLEELLLLGDLLLEGGRFADPGPQGLQALDLLLGLRGLIPEALLRHRLLDPRYLRQAAGDVKDRPGRAPSGTKPPPAAAGSPRTRSTPPRRPRPGPWGGPGGAPPAWTRRGDPRPPSAPRGASRRPR